LIWVPSSVNNKFELIIAGPRQSNVQMLDTEDCEFIIDITVLKSISFG